MQNFDWSFELLVGLIIWIYDNRNWRQMNLCDYKFLHSFIKLMICFKNELLSHTHSFIYYSAYVFFISLAATGIAVITNLLPLAEFYFLTSVNKIMLKGSVDT
jgi:hypothetical protein